tara:strand:+ start:304 stop:984 length:681 start_codon:yes stop_codon:yes gene_type:complete
MYILSIDVGIKNLAHCLLQIEDKTYSIVEWDSIDICNVKKEVCKEFLKNKIKTCDKQACIRKDNKCYCKTHAKKYIEDGVYEEIKYDNAKEIRLVDLGINILEQYDKLFSKYKIDTVIIENQISRIATRMKTIQGMIMQYFIIKQTNDIEFISSTNKLKLFTSKKTDYKERKKMGIEYCKETIIKDENLIKWLNIFEKHKKKDDLADSFLQGLWYMNNRKLIKLFS